MKYFKIVFKFIYNLFTKRVKLTSLLLATTEEQLRNYEAAIVVYKDQTAKHFTIQSWLIFRKGIIENIYKKRLCKIYFVTRITFNADQSNK